MSAAHPPANPVLPRGLLIALGTTVLVTVLSVAAFRLAGVSVREPDAPAVATRLLRFEDRPDGSVAVIDAGSGSTLDQLRGEQGFVRGALRALTRERRMREIGAQPPFELAARADGRLTLTDPATGARIDLESFGPTNAGVFARLLTITDKH
ncbi:photosynthetic complex assembly protein PuhC [Piscinibacter aquaticus]|uniref:Photosynthetic complex assembly protein PuhC n=1 Tax=Piscinibacter aquaticus TaxID=392597 RepID=A0A5C6U3R2_9BURK|nr:photosynthetic complex assembly protein PuhC [Piscinibacter aquaticus]